MLETLRRGTSGVVAKILIALLVLSFAVWGVADVFTGYGQSALATVGKNEITPDEFQRAYQNEMNAISYQAGRRITAEEARAAGLDRRVLSGLVDITAVERHAQNLNLALSEEALIEGLRNDPALQGQDGKFSRAALDNIMRQLGISEQAFLDLRLKDETREQLITALDNGLAPPQPMVDLLHAWREEKRVIDHTTIDVGKVIKTQDPDEAKLKETYEQNKSKFMTPERRRLAVLLLSVDHLKQQFTPTEDEIKARYENDKDTFNTPEKRRLQQISFADRTAAEAAKKAIDGGKSFADAAKETGAKDTDVDLGLVAKSQLIDPKIADAAFKLEKDKVSAPVEGTFTTALLRVAAIEPAVTKTLEDVKDKVRDSIVTDKAKAAIQSKLDEVEDGRAAGKALKEIGELLKLDFVEVASADRTNLTPDGKVALERPQSQTILRAGFEASVGIEGEPVELQDGGYAWTDVLEITKPEQKPFDAVKDEVKALYKEIETDRQLTELSAKLTERLRGGEAIAKIADEVGGKVETTEPVTRSTTPQGLTKDAVTLAFTLPEGGANAADTSSRESRTLFKVTQIKPADAATEDQKKKLLDELRRNMQQDVRVEYVAALRERLGVNINETAFRRVTGQEASQ